MKYSVLTKLLMIFATLSFLTTISSESFSQNIKQYSDACRTSKIAIDKIKFCTIAIGSTTDRVLLERFYLRRGNGFIELNRLADAVNDFSSLIRINPKIAGYYDNRLCALRALGRFSEALSDADSAISLAPNSAFVWRSRGTVFEALQQFPAAINDFTKAIELDPNDIGLVIDRSRIKTKSGKTKEAISDLSAILIKDPANVGAHKERGLAYKIEGNYPSARSDLTIVALSFPDDKEVAQALDTISDKQIQNSPNISTLSQQSSNPPIGSQHQKPLTVPFESPPTAATYAPSERRRIALIIGNADYIHQSKLTNPPRDAEALARALKAAGFQSVTTKTNLTRETMINALREFAIQADSADWAMVYFSGHGVEVSGINYMIPIDATLKADRDVDFEAVDLAKVQSAIDGARKLKLVIIDACRDNPFIPQMKRSVASRSIGRGLAQIEPEAGTLVVYSAKHGQIALDGDGSNSPFVTALTERIKSPNLEVRRLFDLVRDDVLRLTNKKQQPFSYGSLSGSEDFYFTAK